MANPSEAGALKAKMRKNALALRLKLSKPEVAARSADICQRLLATIAFSQGAEVAVYLPISNEVDPELALNRLSEAGFRLALPAVVAKDLPLDFYGWAPGEDLEAGALGTRVPVLKEVCAPSLLIVPLLGFDRAGYRLGFGGGYYDRTLESLRSKRSILSVGLAFCEQELHELPHASHDQRLDWIITDREAIKLDAI